MQLADDLLRGSDAAAASAAVQELAGVGTARARQLIERAVDAASPEVRLAAVSSLAQNLDDGSTDALLRLTRDPDARVRRQALSSLGAAGSERSQEAVLAATRSGDPGDRIAALGGLASIDDPKASAQIAALMRDPDPNVANAAIAAAEHAGAEADRALTAIVNDPAAAADLRVSAAGQLRSRGAMLDDPTEQTVTSMVGTGYGGLGYGGDIDEPDGAPEPPSPPLPFVK